jgi:hypothetical protein
LSGNAKVREFDFAGQGEEDVCGFDVPVDLSLLMEIVEAEEQLLADDGDVCLVEGSRFKLMKLDCEKHWQGLEIPNPNMSLHRGTP